METDVFCTESAPFPKAIKSTVSPEKSAFLSTSISCPKPHQFFPLITHHPTPPVQVSPLGFIAKICSGLGALNLTNKSQTFSGMDNLGGFFESSINQLLRPLFEQPTHSYNAGLRERNGPLDLGEESRTPLHMSGDVP